MNATQLRALIWLRWRLTLNQWRRGGPVSAVIMVVVSVAALAMASLGVAVGILIGWLALSEASARENMLVWDILIGIFLFFWTMGLVTELQRSEILDLRRLMMLPVSLRDVFLLNYVASHFSLSLATMLPLMFGFAAGLTLAGGGKMLLLFPLILAFFFMITAWTYCLRGWLAALMVNKRRRRAIAIGVMTVFVLMFQLPNLVSNVWLRGQMPGPSSTPEQVQQHVAEFEQKKEAITAALDVAHRYVPLLWLPEGARSLAEENPWPAVWGALGMVAIGGLGLVRAYRGTIRFYQGVETAKPAPAAAATPKAAVGGSCFLDRSLPWVPEAAAAMALASLRSMSRAPEIKMAMVTNVLIFTFIGLSAFLRGGQAPPAGVEPIFAAIAVAVAMMGLTQVMFNQFGFDRSGFRSLVLLPTPRRHILLGKNVALAPVAAVVFAVYLILMTIFAHLQAWDVLAGVLEFVAALLLMSVLGNVISIFVPYRVAAGSMRPTKNSGTTKLLIFVTHMLFPLALLPVFLPAAAGMLFGYLDWVPAGLASLAGAVVLVILAGVLYWRTLEPIGRLLERREQRILEVVTQEVE